MKAPLVGRLAGLLGCLMLLGPLAGCTSPQELAGTDCVTALGSATLASDAAATTASVGSQPTLADVKVGLVRAGRFQGKDAVEVLVRTDATSSTCVARVGDTFRVGAGAARLDRVEGNSRGGTDATFTASARRG